MILKSDRKPEKARRSINWQDPKWRRARRLFAGLLIGLLFLVYWLHFRPSWALAGFRSQLREAGEKLAVDEVRRAPVPAEQNSAALFLRAHGLLGTNSNSPAANPPGAMRMVAPGKAMVGSAQAEVRAAPGYSWSELGAALGADREALALLHQIAGHPVLDFELHYGEGLEQIDFSHLEMLQGAADRLEAAALYDLHQGDTRSATTNIVTLLALVQGVQRDQLTRSELVRIGMCQAAMSATWELLQSTNLGEVRLATLQEAWQRIDFVQSAERALEMERAVGRATLLRLRAAPEELTHAMFPDRPESSEAPQSRLERYWERARVKTRELLWQYCWSYSDDLRAEKGDQVLLEATRAIQTNWAFKMDLRQADSQLLELGISGLEGKSRLLKGLLQADLRRFLSRRVLAANKYLHQLMIAETARQMTVTAIALKRYQLRNGTYPPGLVSLVPKYLPAVPPDPVDGRPLRYQLTGVSFLLYSIGEDSVDNGGDPSPPKGSSSFSWLGGRDYVWPAPATEREVQIYEQTPDSGKH